MEKMKNVAIELKGFFGLKNGNSEEVQIKNTQRQKDTASID